VTLTHADLEADRSAFLAAGGRVKIIPCGVLGAAPLKLAAGERRSMRTREAALPRRRKR